MNDVEFEVPEPLRQSLYALGERLDAVPVAVRREHRGSARSFGAGRWSKRSVVGVAAAAIAVCVAVALVVIEAPGRSSKSVVRVAETGNPHTTDGGAVDRHSLCNAVVQPASSVGLDTTLTVDDQGLYHLTATNVSDASVTVRRYGDRLYALDSDGRLLSKGMETRMETSHVIEPGGKWTTDSPNNASLTDATATQVCDQPVSPENVLAPGSYQFAYLFWVGDALTASKPVQLQVRSGGSVAP